MNKPRILPFAVVRRFVVCLLTALPLMVWSQRVEVEYYWVTADGIQQATSTMTVTPDADGNVVFDLPTDELPGGYNYLALRTKVTDDNGASHYSPTVMRVVSKQPSADEAVIIRAEYFWNVDPGYGKGTPLSLTADNEVTIDSEITLPDTLASGIHQLYIRTESFCGWSPTIKRTVSVKRSVENGISCVEYFWDIDPGYGKGTPLAFTQSDEGYGVTTDIVPADSLVGEHTLVVRARSITGQWSPVYAATLNVGIEGSFTLDNTKEAGVERNFLSIAEMLETLSSDEVRGDVDVTVLDGTTFEYDATSDETLSKVTEVTEALAQYGKTVTFKASEGSPAILSFTANDTDKAQLLSLFSAFRTENVTLQLNGETYDFNVLAYTFEEICSGATTEVVDFSTISDDTNLNVVWTAVTHNGIAVTGYQAEGTGLLPSMTLANTTKDKDYVEYSISVMYGEETVCTHTYIIYVYACVSGRSFADISPTNGKSVDPKEQKLSWNKITGAMEYEISIEKVLTSMIEDETAEVESITATTTATSYTLTVESGYTYRWTVKAVGFCDVLQSDTYIFAGRLLPDLGVTLFDVPEYSKSGAPITISAQVTNNGEGATTESSWTDYLYYSFESNDISTAIRLATKSHSGYLNAGDSYTVTFEVTAPLADEGNIYYFVQTDATAKVMETDATNNAAVTDALACQPFIMDAACYEQLKIFYNALGGTGWTKQWKISTDHITAENYPGVTFDSEGRATAINLVNNGLTGTLPEESFVMPQLTTLNLSRNLLTGNVPASFFTDCTALATLNLSYNQLTGVDGTWPATITSLDLSYQHRVYGNSSQLHDLTALGTVELALDKTFEADFGQNALMQYNPSSAAFELRDATLSNTYARFSYSGGYYKLTSLNYTQPQDAELIMLQTLGTAKGSVQPVTVSYVEADANVDQLVDVLDVQHTLNYVVAEKGAEGLFCWSAANTFADELINIQDIVVTVNHVLDHTNATAQARARRMTAAERAKAHGRLYVEDGYLCLTADTAVAALDVELQGASATQVRLMLAAANWQMVSRATDEGVRLVIFSPTGQTLPVGTTKLLALRAEAYPIAADAADAKARSLTIGVEGGNATGLNATELTEALAAHMENGVLHVTSNMECEDVTLSLYDPAGRLLVQFAGATLHTGNNTWHIGQTVQGIYLLQVGMANGTTDVIRIAGK